MSVSLARLLAPALFLLMAPFVPHALARDVLVWLLALMR